MHYVDLILVSILSHPVVHSGARPTSGAANVGDLNVGDLTSTFWFSPDFIVIPEQLVLLATLKDGSRDGIQPLNKCGVCMMIS